MAVSGILIKFIDLGIKLFAISIVVHVVTGWEVVPVIVVSGLITIAYVFIGGLWATVLTDLVQFVVQLFMSLAVLFIVLDMVGGWNAMWDSLPQERAGFFNAAEGISASFWLVYVVVIILSYNGGTWGLAQRFVSVEKPRDAQKAALLSAILYLFLSHRHLRSRVGRAATNARILRSDHTSTRRRFRPRSDLYPRNAENTIDSGTRADRDCWVCSMFAATMSMIDSDINALAAVFTKDFYQRNFKREIDDRALFRAGMTTTAIFGIAVLVTAVVISQSQGMNKVFSLTVKLFGGLLSPIAIPLMLGMIWKRPTARGAILSFIGGVITYFIMIQYTDRV